LGQAESAVHPRHYGEAPDDPAAATRHENDIDDLAVAIGAACDFLTPIGHQSNLLVMGPGGYSFGDYWKLGFPLSIMVVLAGVPLIALFWPFKPS
jgi:di/tricarboxylate transporter